MKTIGIEGQSKVVEYESGGGLIRRILPIDEESAEMGIPYGLPFAVLLTGYGLDERAARRIEMELHRAGLWTGPDIQANPRAVQGAIQAAYGVDTAILLNLVRKFEGGR